MPTMYRCPGELRHTTRGFLYDQREFSDVQQARADGWAETLEEAAGRRSRDKPRPMPTPAPSPVTRAELEAEAEALGIGFNARTSDEKLIERIAARG
jgi:hypothetical protein